MSELRVNLFGKFSAWQDDRCLDSLLASKAQELFAYILLYRDQIHARETLAERLWGESTPSQSKKNLRQILWKLRSTLGDEREPRNEHLLVMRDEWIQVGRQPRLWLDVEAFEQAYILTPAIQGETIDDHTAHTLAEAVRLYQGDLLEGWYQDWCVYERERFQFMLLSMLDKLMDHCRARRNYEHGIQYGLRILRHDRAREQTHRKLMRLCVLTGDRTGALRQFHLCAAALAEELDVAPARRTLALYEEIRADQWDHSLQDAGSTDGDPESRDDQLAGIVSRFDHLEAMLADNQRALEQQIQSIGSALEKAVNP